MAFDENAVLRDTSGRFSEQIGTAPTVTLDVRTLHDRNREQSVIDEEKDAAASKFAAEHGVYVEVGESQGFDYETGDMHEVTVTNPHGGSYTYVGSEPQNPGVAMRTVMHHARLIRDDEFYRGLVGEEKAAEMHSGTRAVLGRDFDRLATLSGQSAPPLREGSDAITSGHFTPAATDEQRAAINGFLDQAPVRGRYEKLSDDYTSAVLSRSVNGRGETIRVTAPTRQNLSTESAMEALIAEAREQRYGRFGFRGDKQREAEFKRFFGKDLKHLAR